MFYCLCSNLLLINDAKLTVAKFAGSVDVGSLGRANGADWDFSKNMMINLNENEMRIGTITEVQD